MICCLRLGCLDLNTLSVLWLRVHYCSYFFICNGDIKHSQRQSRGEWRAVRWGRFISTLGVESAGLQTIETVSSAWLRRGNTFWGGGQSILEWVATEIWIGKVPGGARIFDWHLPSLFVGHNNYFRMMKRKVALLALNYSFESIKAIN